MTPQQIEALKQMYQLLLTEPHAPTVCAQLERIAREALAEHAMSEVQRLGQEIEPKIGCVNHDCDQCKAQPEQEHPVYSPFISCELWRLSK